MYHFSKVFLFFFFWKPVLDLVNNEKEKKSIGNSQKDTVGIAVLIVFVQYFMFFNHFIPQQNVTQSKKTSAQFSEA